MEFRNIDKIDVSGLKRRYALKRIKDFIENNNELGGKIVVLFGLRRTGKTTIMEQIVSDYRDKYKCAFCEVKETDDMDTINDKIIELRNEGVRLICLDEITKAKDFITDSASLADVFAKEGMKIIVAGADSLGFVFADNTELFDRTMRIRTTHIPFAEHCYVLDVDDIDDYILYGGLMRKGAEEINVSDYESAKKYLDSSVSENIASSIDKDFHNNELKKLSVEEVRTIIEKLVELYSGVFNKKLIQNELKSISINKLVDRLAKTEYADYVYPVSVTKANVRKDFIKEINADKTITTTITDNMIQIFENYLIDMDLLSATSKKIFQYTDEFGWREYPEEKTFYIVQPAIKYYHLKKGIEFIEESQYFQSLPRVLKNEMKSIYENSIKGEMMEQIAIFDIAKILDNKKYYVCKPMFLVNGENKGEYDILVYDNQENVYWAVEVKHSSEICEEQSKHLRNPFFKEIIDRQYGTRADFFVLYRGESQISNGVKYINIADFMFELYESKDINETLLQIGEEFALEQELSSEDDEDNEDDEDDDELK